MSRLDTVNARLSMLRTNLAAIQDAIATHEKEKAAIEELARLEQKEKETEKIEPAFCYPTEYPLNDEFFEILAICPECKEKCQLTCKCNDHEWWCKNGHNWHHHAFKHSKQAFICKGGQGDKQNDCLFCNDPAEGLRGWNKYM